MAKNLKQLLDQIAALQRQADALKTKERAGVIARIQEAISHYNITSEELFARPARVKNKGPAQATAGKPSKRRKNPVKKGIGEPRYHDGAGRTWTGRGPRPSWFVQALTEGRTRESMLITRPDVA